MKVDLSALELVSINGELALVIRLGARAGDPVAPLEKVKRAYRVAEPEDDTVGSFLADQTRQRPGARYRAGLLQKAYAEWCEGRGLKRQGKNGFVRAMKARGYRRVVSNGHWWQDLAPVADDSGPLI